MAVYHLLKSAYRVLPRRLRTFLWTNPVTRGPREWLLRRAERLATHAEMYDRDYFQNVVDAAAARSAPIMAGKMHDALHPSSVVDVGCGTGQMLLAFQKLGASCRGLEYSEAALAICRERGLDVVKFDLEQEQSLDWRADLVVSTEVAEHLPASCADRYVDLLCRTSDQIMITAAVPGSTGTDHVNEQPNEYWIAKLVARGFEYDQPLSYRWRDEWRDAGVDTWYWNSAMFFRRVSRSRA